MENDTRPQWILDMQAPGTEPVSIIIDGQEYKYTIVDNQIEQNSMPYVVGFTADGFLMISQKVPALEKTFILSHEVREQKNFLNLPQEQRCLAALQQELKDFQNEFPSEYDNYLQKRYEFFNALASYYQNQQRIGQVTPEFLKGIISSRDFLHAVSASRR